VLDIDTFKSINDGYGHPVGDTVLRMVAERISAALQGEGVLGRLGGEEFGILFETSMKTAEAICRRAVELVGSIPCLVAGGVLLRVTLSAGLAACPDEDAEPAWRVDRGYELADKALYAAKHAGRHQLVVAPAA
jgi:diguanylate cyclase (GGDEF)-like protein